MKRKIGKPLLTKLLNINLVKIPRYKKVEFRLHNKRVFMMKCDEELVIGIISN